VPWILDTDHLSILQLRNQPEYLKLRQKLAEVPETDVFASIISFQEQVQGWLEYLKRARDASGVLRAYKEMQSVLRYYCESSVLPFDQVAQGQFDSLRGQRIRVGTLDLRIASIALASGSILLSRNQRDFRKVPGLRVEDWTRS